MWSGVILQKDWTHIKRLYLWNCSITDDSIDTLLKVEWPNLTHLWLGENELSDAGVKKNTIKDGNS